MNQSGTRAIFVAIVFALGMPATAADKSDGTDKNRRVVTTYGEQESADRPQPVRRIRSLQRKLRPLNEPLGEPAPNDWLASHKEPGQTFDEYLVARPIVPRGERKNIYVLPVGEFTKKQRQIVELSAEFLACYYHRPVKVQESLPLSVIPAEARREHPVWGMKQILSTHVLNDVLAPRLPDDAAAYIALTASDLWPGEGWNFVFGQASLRQRVGVWSMHRNGDLEGEQTDYQQYLLRTLKTASHEVGHMFSMRHCTRCECNMCGSNHRAESDSRPLTACSECVAKIWWATGADPVERYQRLATFCEQNGLAEQQAAYEKAAAAIGD